jgi:hypothetical protein
MLLESTIKPATSPVVGLVRLWGLRVALQPERSQAVHIFDHRLVPSMLFLEGILNLRLATLVFIEYRFGYFAVFCAHHACFFRGIMRDATRSSFRRHPN